MNQAAEADLSGEPADWRGLARHCSHSQGQTSHMVLQAMAAAARGGIMESDLGEGLIQ